jgi:aspartate kinase
MKIVVLKFGGTSVGSIERIKKVAKIIASYKKKNYKVLLFLQQ